MTTAAKKHPDNGAAARREVSGEPPTIDWKAPNGQTLRFKLPPKAPFRLLKFFAKGENIGPVEMVGIADALFGTDQFEQFWDLELDMEKGAEAFGEVLELAFGEYGFKPGESAASPTS